MSSDRLEALNGHTCPAVPKSALVANRISWSGGGGRGLRLDAAKVTFDGLDGLVTDRAGWLSR